MVFIYPFIYFRSAENDALRKASTAQPTGLASIPRPEKGVSGKGFNLRAATGMGLGEDPTLYCTVHVSFLFLLLSSLTNQNELFNETK